MVVIENLNAVIAAILKWPTLHGTTTIGYAKDEFAVTSVYRGMGKVRKWKVETLSCLHQRLYDRSEWRKLRKPQRFCLPHHVVKHI